MTTQSLKFKRKFKTEDTEKNWSCSKTLKSVRIDLDEIKDRWGKRERQRQEKNVNKEREGQGLPGGPVAKTPSSQGRVARFDH